jgi:hypothetical protein
VLSVEVEVGAVHCQVMGWGEVGFVGASPISVVFWPQYWKMLEFVIPLKSVEVGPVSEPTPVQGGPSVFVLVVTCRINDVPCTQ